MDTKELFNLYESYLNIYEAPFEITGPHSYKTGDGRPQDDSIIKNTPTVVGTYKGDDSATRKKARNKADKLNQEYGASVYRVNRTDEPRKRGTTVKDSVESDYDKLINERTNISYAREAITNIRNNLKKYPQGYKGDDFNHELKLAKSAFKNQVKQEREKRKANEDVEYVLDYLVNEGFTDSYDGAEAILETMSDEWLDSIIEARKVKIKVDVKRPIEWKIADIGPGKKEYNIKTSKD
jgi:hypothetical protein